MGALFPLVKSGGMQSGCKSSVSLWSDSGRKNLQKKSARAMARLKLANLEIDHALAPLETEVQADGPLNG
jgi:hypothetical protein